MRNGEIIICGLTEWEQQEIKEHKGECKHCGHYYDSLFYGGRIVPCSKEHIPENNTCNDCEDWILDMR